MTHPTSRGQSEVLSIALIVGIVVAATTFLVVFGATSVNDSMSDVTVAQAERALEALDASASAIAFGEAKTTTIDLGLTGRQGSLDSEPNAGWMEIRAFHPVDPNKTIVNTTLGAVTYTQGDTTLAYQAGGLWRLDDGAAVMQAPPEFHYNDGTLIASIIRTRGAGAIQSDVQITQGHPPIRDFPDASRGLENKLRDINAPVIEITVHSAYYEAWARFFNAETQGGVVTVSHSKETATLTMPTLAGTLPLDVGVISTSGAGEFFVAGNSRYIDSYNSSQGDYDATNGENATLRSAGDVTMEGTSEVRGDIKSGGNVSMTGSAHVTGDVEWTKTMSQGGGATVDGDVTQIKGVEPVQTISWLVDRRIDTAQSANDNNETSVIVNNELDLASGEQGELGHGTYYFDELDVDRSTLVLDTTNGDVTVAVADWTRLTNKQAGDASAIKVEGDGIARIFIGSRDTVRVSPTGLGNRDVHLHVGKGAQIHVPAENSTQLRIYGPTPFKSTITGSNGQLASVDAIIYAPAGRNGSGYIWLKHADLYGAVSAGEITAGQNGAIHFNQATAGVELNILPDIADIEFMHVSRRTINVTAQ